MSRGPGWFAPLRRLVQNLLEANLRAALDADEVVVRTSRYIRLAIVGLVLGLAASLAFELARVHHAEGQWCLLGSVSAYYYTPVHGFLIGALVTIGVALFAVRGNTVAENTLLNFAGVCAPFVAFVPTGTVPTDLPSHPRRRPPGAGHRQQRRRHVRHAGGGARGAGCSGRHRPGRSRRSGRPAAGRRP